MIALDSDLYLSTMEVKSRTRILDDWSVRQIIRRLAHQVLEDHYREDRIAIVGVQGMGAAVAALLEEEFSAISDIPFECFEVVLNKQRPAAANVAFLGDFDALNGCAVLLVDDVLNSGKTLSYAMAHLLAAEPKSLKTVVLVDRIHRTFPIRADYHGVLLSTNMKEHVSVEFVEGAYAAWLE